MPRRTLISLRNNGVMTMTTGNDDRAHGRLVGVARGEVAWFGGLVLLLGTDLALRNLGADLPRPAVFAAWAVAFVLPTLLLYGRRRRPGHSLRNRRARHVRDMPGHERC